MVQETIDGAIGTIVDWSQEGWVVFFPDHNCIFHVKPSLLEVIDEGR